MMEAILNFQQDLDVALFDKIVSTSFLSRNEIERKKAEEILNQFKSHPDAWQKTDAILAKSQSPEGKYIGLQILESLVKVRWKVLPKEQTEGIKTYIVSLIIKNSSDEVTLQKERLFVGKLNLVLVQILKQEWPKDWPSFIPDIVNSSRTNLSLCENNMKILKLLSEEVFDFSYEQMTTSKTKKLKEQLCGEFSQIFQLCDEVLRSTTKSSLVLATLDSLLRFLKWIPLGYIFETNLIPMLRERCFSVPAFRNVTLGCFTEIGSLSIGPEYDQHFYTLFELVIGTVKTFLPLTPETSLAKIYEDGDPGHQEFIQNLGLFLTSFLSAHLQVVENGNRSLLLDAHLYLLKISEVDDREVFKVCLEYWLKLVNSLYHEAPVPSIMDYNPYSMLAKESPLMLNGNGLGTDAAATNRRSVYAALMSDLRLIMINNMVKPEEVLVVENDNGEIVREFTKETDTITLYKSMRECLVYLTHLDYEDTENIMTEKLARQVDGSEWSWNNLNKLCWAIGSISGAMSEEVEKRFLVLVIKDLLGLTEMKRGKDNKAVCASNIMYIVGQYPRFLKAHWKFLKTVVKKLFEFMHETHEGVQDMSCDTFIKIAQKCRKHFIIVQQGEVKPFIEEIIEGLHETTVDLQNHQVHTFYEAVGYMIQAQTETAKQTTLITHFMRHVNTQWDRYFSMVANNMAVLKDEQVVKGLGDCLKTNVSSCTSIGAGFISQFGRIYMDMLNIYKVVSSYISEEIVAHGPTVIRHSLIRSMRVIKKETLKLIDIFVQKTEDSAMVLNNIVPPLFEIILQDYSSNDPRCRDAEVLTTTATLVVKLEGMMTDKINLILSAVFQCTLDMINKDFSEFPDHRVAFFKLIQAINMHCFPALLSLPPTEFKLFVDSIVWAFKHTVRDVAEYGLTICIDLLKNINTSDPSIANSFYQSFYINLLQDIFYVLTDADHKSSFKLQATILAHMFGLVARNQIIAPLFNPATEDPSMNNSTFLRNFVGNLLCNAFPNLKPVEIETFVIGLFDLNGDINVFKPHLRDFLIKMKEFSGDNQELFLEEQELEKERKVAAERDAAQKIPGLIKPSEQADEMID